MSKESLTPELRIYNTNIKIKRELMSIAKSEGMTLTKFVMKTMKEKAATFPAAAKNYLDDDGC